METLTGGGELRAEGRTLHGVVMRYNELAADRPERFTPGSLVPAPTSWLEYSHDFNQILAYTGGGLSFEDTGSELRMRVDLPSIPLADKALKEVRDGTRRGLSVRFNVSEEHTEKQTGVRVITRASMPGVGLVKTPAYAGAGISEVRRRMGGFSRIIGRANLGKKVSCSCKRGCNSIRIAPDALDEALAEAVAGKRQITAFLSGHYNEPVASLGRGMTLKRRGNTLHVEIDDLPDTESARAFLESQKVSFTSVRLYMPEDTSTVSKEGTTAIYSKADLVAVEVATVTGPTDGLVPLVMGSENRMRIFL